MKSTTFCLVPMLFVKCFLLPCNYRVYTPKISLSNLTHNYQSPPFCPRLRFVFLSMKNQKPKTMSIHICTLYNNGSFAIKFTKLFLQHIFSILSIFFFSIFTLFNFSSSSTIVFLDHPFIYSYHCLFKFSPLYLLKFYRFTLLNLSHLLPPFLFHFNFHINFLLLHFHISHIFLPSRP